MTPFEERARDLAQFNTPPWYRPIKRLRWKRYGVVISANKMREALGLPLLPLRKTARSITRD